LACLRAGLLFLPCWTLTWFVMMKPKSIIRIHNFPFGIEVQ
jgi:hypothetical protein